MSQETTEVFWPSFLLGAQAGIILTMAGVYLAHWFVRWSAKWSAKSQLIEADRLDAQAEALHQRADKLRQFAILYNKISDQEPKHH